jgi:transposase-like protein
LSDVIQLDGREYPPEAVWQAQELYCIARLSYKQVSEELGIAGSTLKRWGKEYGWKEKRAELAQAMADMRGNIILARADMIKELLDSKDPMVGFAVAKLEELALKQAEAERQGKLAQAQAAPPRREIKTEADAYSALREIIETRLGNLLLEPEKADVKAIKEIKDALALLSDLEPKGDKPKGTKGLSAEQVELFRKKILGG